MNETLCLAQCIRRRIYTNEVKIGRALLPDRFESTSVPVPVGIVEEGTVNSPYTLPTTVETKTYEVALDVPDKGPAEG